MKERKPRKSVVTTKAAIAARRNAFLEAFGKLGTIRAAAQAAGIERKTHYKWLKKDKKYRTAFQERETEAIERLEEEARRRAYVGTVKPVVYQGKVAQRVNANGKLEDLVMREYSDTLLIFLLKGAKPEKYRERFEHTGPQGGPISFEQIFTVEKLNGMSTEELKVLRAALSKLQDGKTGNA